MEGIMVDRAFPASLNSWPISFSGVRAAGAGGRRRHYGFSLAPAGSGLHADGETSGIDCRLIHCYQELSTAPMSGVVLWLTARNRHMEPPWSRLL